MKKLKIAFFEIEPREINYLKPKLNSFDLTFFEEKITRERLKEIPDIDILSSFIYSVIDKKILNFLKFLKFIATRSTGFDHLDLKTCKDKNIFVSNVPSYGENTVAEHTFALILALSMNILAFDVRKDQKFAQEFGFKYVPLSYLFRNSDIITLHVPYNKSTHHMINLKTLKLFKKGCYLINTARGGVCDTTALLEGLKQGIFAGLGLDVLEKECFIKEERELLTSVFKKTCDLKAVLENHILINHPDVIITPHNSFNSKEALQRI